MAELRARGLGVTIGQARVCRELDLRLAGGQCWGLLGRNGAGKTTLLHTLAGLRAALAGRVELNGRDLTAYPRRAVAGVLGLLPQETSEPFPASVLETALIGRHPHLGRWAWEGPRELRLARSALRAVDLEGMEERLVTTLSGGEHRRLAMATLLTQDPEIMLLDEPTNHLDLRHQVRLLERLRSLARERGKAVLMTLHELNLAERYCDHLLLLFGAGESLSGPTASVLSAANVERLYDHPVARIEQDGRGAWLPR